MLSTPSYSCRSGLSILLQTFTRRGVDAAPFKLDIQRRMSADEAFHVISAQPRSLAQV